jgi:hypothetical protein
MYSVQNSFIYQAFGMDATSRGLNTHSFPPAHLLVGWVYRRRGETNLYHQHLNCLPEMLLIVMKHPRP